MRQDGGILPVRAPECQGRYHCSIRYRANTATTRTFTQSPLRTGNLSRVYPAFRLMTAGIGSSATLMEKRLRNWMDGWGLLESYTSFQTHSAELSSRSGGMDRNKHFQI
ncbi:hypothetical protein SRHO_G00148130 [Serrasalmus rhombeus]